jgi:hypothetical protein
MGSRDKPRGDHPGTAGPANRRKRRRLIGIERFLGAAALAGENLPPGATNRPRMRQSLAEPPRPRYLLSCTRSHLAKMPSHLAMTVLIATSMTAGVAIMCARAIMMQAKIKTVRIRTGQHRRAD